MVDINISNFSDKVQRYIAENNIDRNNDGKINQGNGELQILLFRRVNSIEPTDTFNKKNIDKIPDFIGGEMLLAYFSNLTLDERTALAEKTKTEQEVKLETLKNAIKTSYNSFISSIQGALSSRYNYSQYGIAHGIDSSNKDILTKVFRDLIASTAAKFKEAQWDTAMAIDVYTGARAYADDCGLGSGYTDYSGYGNRIQVNNAEQQVIEKLGYANFDDFINEFMNYDISNAGASVEEKYAYLVKQYNMVKNFEEKLVEVYEPYVQAKEEEGMNKYNEQFEINEKGKQQLDYIVTNPPNADDKDELIAYRRWLVMAIGITFLTNIAEHYKTQHEADGIESPKVNINGKEYEVGKKYRENGPNGKPRIVSYDKLGNKYDITHGGIKIND